jgi:hypothetical protein
MRNVWIETGVLMAITFVINLALFAYHTPFWIAAVATLGMFLGADMYYHHAQGGHKDE